MAGRAQCGAGPSRGPRNPGLTRAAQLRQAKSAAFVKEQGAKDDALAARMGGACAAGPRKTGIPKFGRGPPPAEPKKVNMQQPGLTKAMMARMKHSQDLVANLSRERNEAVFQKRQIPKRPPGERRVLRQPKRLPPAACAPPPEPREEWQPQGPLQQAALKNPGVQKFMRMREQRMAKNAPAACGEAGPSSAPGACPKSPQRRQMPLPQAQSTMARNNSGVSERTCELAQSMNADVLQAEAVGEGPVQNIVIPPGALSQCRTTIVALPAHNQSNNSSMDSMERSMLAIEETLNNQDLLESLAIQEKLGDLQDARRDFVMAVANVGNNVINISDNRQNRNRGLCRVPEIDDDQFRVEYGRDHPAVMAARDFRTKTSAAMQERENDMRLDREFARAARCEDGLRLDVPFEQEIMEGDISFEEDEDGVIIPCASRIKASMPPIPQKHVAAVPDAICPDELERFFNVERYPAPGGARQFQSPPRGPRGSPAGRTGLNRDLWDLEDPWYRECPPPEMPDLIDFNDY